MSKKLLVLPGDGIGQEVTASTVEVLNYLVDANNLDIEISYNDVGGASYDKYGEPLTEEVLKEAKASDAILFGAVGGPKYDDLPWEKRPENALLGLRKELQLFANLRPSYLFNELASASPIKDSIIQGLDILIVRELTGGIYFGEPRSIESDKAFNTMVYNYDEIARILKVAFEAASKRNKKLCSVDKANVLEVSKFWRSITKDIAKEYPDVEVSHQLVDNAAMQLVLDPNQFDVIVSSNLFGDILSDIAATLSGSIGMLPSASLNAEGQGMYEPCHGSAPDIAGQDIANPLAMIGSLSMALNYSLDMQNISSQLDSAIKNFVSRGYRTVDIAVTGEPTLKTSEVAKEIIKILEEG